MVPATVIVCLSVIAISLVRKTSPLIEVVIHTWARMWFVLSRTELEVRGDFDRSRSHVVVSNHSSWFDIFANFLATPVPLRFLAKKELFAIPLLAPAMRAIGIIEIDRNKATSMHQWINDQAKVVAGRAQSIMVYPEGTRTRDGEVQRFKAGAFIIAIQNNLPLLPVTIAGSYDAFPPEGALLRGGRIIVEIGEPIPTELLERSDLRELTRATQELVASTRARLDEELRGEG
jgi:1-acyl-sn-glycerol-3-phosphate acyltransferase